MHEVSRQASVKSSVAANARRTPNTGRATVDKQVRQMHSRAGMGRLTVRDGDLVRDRAS